MNKLELQNLVSCPHQMLIDGEMCSSSDGKTLETINPATGQVLTEFPDASPDDIDRAVQSSNGAQQGWAELGRCLKNVYVAPGWK